MHILNSTKDFFSEIARAADLSLKPWKHSIVYKDDSIDIFSDDFNELIVCLECRDIDGERCSQNDLEIEIFRSGADLNITIAWLEFPQRPILWQGKHSLWMNATNGKRSSAPVEGEALEAFARRLRAICSMLKKN